MLPGEFRDTFFLQNKKGDAEKSAAGGSCFHITLRVCKSGPIKEGPNSFVLLARSLAHKHNCNILNLLPIQEGKPLLYPSFLPLSLWYNEKATILSSSNPIQQQKNAFPSVQKEDQKKIWEVMMVPFLAFFYVDVFNFKFPE